MYNNTNNTNNSIICYECEHLIFHLAETYALASLNKWELVSFYMYLIIVSLVSVALISNIDKQLNVYNNLFRCHKDNIFH